MTLVMSEVMIMICKDDELNLSFLSLGAIK